MDILDIEKRRKIRFFILSSTFGTGILVIFLLINVINRAFSLMIMDFILIAVLVLWYIALKKYRSYLTVFRIGLAAIIITFVAIVAKGDADIKFLYTLFFLPLVLFFYLNKREGAIWCMALWGILGLLLLFPLSFEMYYYDRNDILYFLLSLLLVIIIAYQLESSRSQYSDMFLEEHNKLEREKERLEKALEEIKTLSGMLPICAVCKKIRDDEGYWNRIEEYLSEHSDVKFSHGICPQCAKELYPGLIIKGTEKNHELE